MATEKQKETAKQYFESSPSENALYISTDGQVFLQKNYDDGVNHQRRIDPGQKLTAVYRKDLEAPKPEEDYSMVPDEKWTKEKIIEWLTANAVETTGKETKAILLEMVDKTILENQDLDENE
jgi:glutamyl/glutaminyl-tRNA synthetase